MRFSRRREEVLKKTQRRRRAYHGLGAVPRSPHENPTKRIYPSVGAPAGGPAVSKAKAAPGRAAITRAVDDARHPDTSTPVYLLTIPQAATSLSVSVRTLYNLLADGEIESVALRGRRLLRTRDLEAFATARPNWGSR
jgi:excisionase family DNA binding protein